MDAELDPRDSPPIYTDIGDSYVAMRNYAEGRAILRSRHRPDAGQRQPGVRAEGVHLLVVGRQQRSELERPLETHPGDPESSRGFSTTSIRETGRARTPATLVVRGDIPTPSTGRVHRVPAEAVARMPGG